MSCVKSSLQPRELIVAIMILMMMIDECGEQQLQDFCDKGIPNKMRGEIWKRLARVEELRSNAPFPMQVRRRGSSGGASSPLSLCVWFVSLEILNLIAVWDLGFGIWDCNSTTSHRPTHNQRSSIKSNEISIEPCRHIITFPKMEVQGMCLLSLSLKWRLTTRQIH